MPAAGADLGVGDLRKQFESAYLGGPPITQPGWTTSAALDFSAAYADPANDVGILGQKHYGPDFYSIISPTLNITGSGPRLQGTFTAAPQFRGYLQYGSLNTYDTDFNGTGRAIILPETLFIDLAGTSALQSRAGGLATASSVSPNDAVQTTTLSFTPTLVHKFGDIGTVQLSNALSESLTDAQTKTTNSAFDAPLNTGTTVTDTLKATVTGGDMFGQLSTALSFSDANSAGGELQGARRVNANWENDYAFSRQWTGLSSFGYEQIQYGGQNHYKYAGATWSLGARWLPNQDSSIEVTYGRHDAGTSASVDASYAPTARLRLTARYSNAITTPQQRTQQLLSTASLNSSGQFIDPRTGLPITSANNFFALQSGPINETSGSVSATLLDDRNTYSLSVVQDNSSPLTPSSTNASPNSRGIFGNFAYQRELNPNLNASAFIQYGVRSSKSGTTASDQDSLSIGNSINWTISETLSARAQFTYTAQMSNQPGLSQNQILFLVGLHKSF